MRAKPPSILDDRQREVPAWTFSGGSGADAFEQDLAVRVAHVTAQQMRRWGWAWALIMPLAIIPIVALRLSTWFMVVPMGVMILIMQVGMQRARRSESLRTRQTLLSAGRCGSCAYPVAHLPPEADQCVKCPECGAAWKHDPEWARRLAVADAAARETIGIRKDQSTDDQATAQWFARFFAGISGRRSLAMRDERGRLVTLFFPRFPWKNPPCWDEVDPAARKSLRREIRLLGWPVRVFLALCFAFPAIMQFPMLSRIPSTVALPSIAQIAISVWLFVLLPLMLFGILMFPHVRKPETMAQLFLRRGLCPGCWADLTKIPLSPDGVRECRHCLAAWKLDGDAQAAAVTDSTSPTRTPPNPQAAPRSG